MLGDDGLTTQNFKYLTMPYMVGRASLDEHVKVDCYLRKAAYFS